MMNLPVAKRWFDRRWVDEATTLLQEPHVDPLLRGNIWYVRGRDRDMLVDTGLGVVSLLDEIKDLINKPLVAIATHGHLDHIGGMHEFNRRLIHATEAPLLVQPIPFPLIAAEVPPDLREMLARIGYPVNDFLLTAVPYQGYDLAKFRTEPSEATKTLVEGNVIDLGDRVFDVLHLPGHSPGSIGLWEQSRGILFAGDAIYDGPLVDEGPDSDINDYCQTMMRLRDLPVRVVHGGHEDSFGQERLVEIAEDYLDRRGA